MQTDHQDIHHLLTDVGARLGRLEEHQHDVLEEVRSNHAALLRLEGALETRVAESRGKHDLTAQHDQSQDEQIKLLHSRVTNLKRGLTSALCMGLTALLAVCAMLTQWFSTR